VPIRLAKYLVALAVVQVASWGVLLLADCPDDAVCTGAQGTVAHSAGLAIYMSWAGILLVGFAGLLWVLVTGLRRIAHRGGR
jgi:hypothetical protein